MPDETTIALQEIAALLRRRVEQHDEAMQRTTENMAKIESRNDLRVPAADQFEMIRKDGEARRSEMLAMMEQRNERTSQEKKRLQDEERQFRERLLAELERHNALLERLLSQSI